MPARSLVPWSLRLSAIFPALQTRSLHTPLEMDAAGTEREEHTFTPWLMRATNEAGNCRVHGG